MTSHDADPQPWSPPPPAATTPPASPTAPTVSLSYAAAAPDQPTESIQSAPTTIMLAAPAAGELLRFGPGVPVPVVTQDMSQATAVWRGEAQPAEDAATTAINDTRRRRRRLLSWLLPLLVLLAVLAILLWQHSGSPLTVTDAAVHASSPALTCDGTATITAEVRTNGNSGTITYRWRRSDGTVSDTLGQRVAQGSTDAHVVLLWSFHGHGAMSATATLEVLDPSPRSASTTFTYACP